MPATETANSQKIRHIVRIRQMLKRWRRKAHTTAARGTPSDVPAGHLAVCVGSSCRRFIVPATHLNHPIFKRLLVRAEEEYGFANVGPLTIPCDESLFEEIVRVVSRSDPTKSGRSFSLEDFQRCCHVDVKNKLDLLNESRPLLYGFADKSVC
ncbi:auxin-responsive protein SAUR50-like [Carica papaya]|uniref:auxin-responsive protein SAUR50-like n=1 Tax=Carica papaya TaxID=3649 RepID=UPI000B8D0B05|nr:auxin-responsive protein SAUR50-like [Carica papaya]